MSVLVAFSASKWYVLIVYSLRPVLIMIFQGYGPWEGFGDIDLDTDASIGGVPSLLGCL